MIKTIYLVSIAVSEHHAYVFLTNPCNHCLFTIPFLSFSSVATFATRRFGEVSAKRPCTHSNWIILDKNHWTKRLENNYNKHTCNLLNNREHGKREGITWPLSNILAHAYTKALKATINILTCMFIKQKCAICHAISAVSISNKIIVNIII